MRHSPARTCIRRIVSGGQTGVDRGALDAAIALQIEHGGWCPRGRRAEDGVIPERYQLRETSSRRYQVRTRQNVLDSDGTLILFRGELTGGSAYTLRVAAAYERPHLLVNLEGDPDPTACARWIVANRLAVLNIAGPRESTSVGIQEDARKFVEAVFNSCG
jgi:hypothetical protein